MPECERCCATFLLRDGDELTRHCDHCAHELVEGALAGGAALVKQIEDLTTELTGLRKALKTCAQHAHDAIARVERLEKERADVRDCERENQRLRAGLKVIADKACKCRAYASDIAQRVIDGLPPKYP